MSKILIVEDDEKLARYIELELTHEGYEAAKSGNGSEAFETICENDFDLVLLDVMLPGINGMEVLRRLQVKENASAAEETEPFLAPPVILLTARDAVMDKVAGLDAGAADYITKPFAIEELLARIRVALKLHPRQDISNHKRLPKNAIVTGMDSQEAEAVQDAGGTSNPAASVKTAAQADTNTFVRTSSVADVAVRNNSHYKEEQNESLTGDENGRQDHIITWHDLTMDLHKYRVTYAGDEITLTNREFLMLKCLLDNRDIVMGRDTLLSKVCGYDYVGETNVVDVYIRYLRSKIDDAYKVKMIHTVRGVGYVIYE